jgi:diguanylate cyclase (GGDEF)-like protein
VVLVVRDGTTRRMVTRVLRSVAGGQPLSETARLVCESVAARWPQSAAAVVVGERDGGRTVTSVGLSDAFVDHAASLVGLPTVDGDGDVPDGVAIVELADLPEAIRSAAKDAGFDACAVVAVPDPGADDGYLVAWFDHAVIARLEFSHDADELVELLALAVERRHDLFQLWRSARHDALTGLLNRAGFFEVVDDVLAAARADAGVTVTVAYVDLDGFKAVNDLLGHAEGDRLLVDVAARLRSAVRADDLVARIGGDEFVVVARTDGPDAAAALRDRIHAAIGEASIGVALDDGAATADALLERADAAMYEAKRGRRQR